MKNQMPRIKTDTILTATVNDGKGQRLVYGSFQDFFTKIKGKYIKKDRFSNVGKTVTRSRLQFDEKGQIKKDAEGHPIYEPFHSVSTTLAL
jgi:hypothetical protein